MRKYLLVLLMLVMGCAGGSIVPLSAEAGSFGDWQENRALDYYFNGREGGASTVCVALYTAAPDDTGGGTEVTNANSYARVQVTAWDAAASGATANTSAITFATVTGAQWGTVTHFAMWDSCTWGAGNLYGWGALAVSKTLGVGDTGSFAAGELDITLD